MIRYALKCSDDHGFESWFASAEAFDGLYSAGMVCCPVCGSSDVEKALMAPQVRTSRRKAARPSHAPDTPQPGAQPLAAPSSELEKALRKLREQVEKNSEYVGRDFAAEARKIHEGEAEERSIYGEAKPDEAKQLIEDGIPVAPLPFIPQRKTN